MPNWLQLITDTAEFTPGVWFADLPPDDKPNRAAHVSSALERLNLMIAAVHIRRPYAVGEAPGADQGRDPERDANARLIADAPQMLTVLASMANALDMAERFPAVARELFRSHCQMAETILLRHVRPGCSPTDSENEPTAPAPHSVESMERFLKEPWE